MTLLYLMESMISKSGGHHPQCLRGQCHGDPLYGGQCDAFSRPA